MRGLYRASSSNRSCRSADIGFIIAVVCGCSRSRRRGSEFAPSADCLRYFDYTKQGIVTAFRMKKLIFNKLGAQDFTKPAEGDSAAFEETIDGKLAQLNTAELARKHLSHGR
jgi:hypothetical protein